MLLSADFASAVAQSSPVGLSRPSSLDGISERDSVAYRIAQERFNRILGSVSPRHTLSIMTSDNLHDLDPAFEWKPTYMAQLKHIADTDEFLHEDEQQLPSSSASTSSPSAQALPHPGAYDWPVLKDAIKYRIRDCLQEYFSEERPRDLHPASVLIPWCTPGFSFMTTLLQRNEGLLGYLPEGAQKGEEAGAAETAEVADDGAAAESTPSAASQMDSSSATGADAPAERTEGKQDGEPSDPQQRQAQASTSATSQPPSPSQATPISPQLLHPPEVHMADAQDFYPSKRRSTTTTVPPLSPDEIAKQTCILFSMLDDFDVQPPFTIQRLCELIVAPTSHYNSGAKWVAALKRCLSVTATRDAFPISPVQAPVGIELMNGTHGEEGSQTDMSEVDMDRMDGLPPSSARSRSSSVASNANSEPLFSPIPFIVRDENGQLTDQQAGAESERAGVDATLMDQIPDLELGGADRTHAMGVLPKEVVDVAPTAPAAAASDDQQDVPMAEADEPMQEAEPQPPVSTEASGSVAAAVDATQTIPESSASVEPQAATAAASEPLGVPDGEVDEIDNPTQTVHPLTSTTSSTTTTAAMDAPGDEEKTVEPEAAQPTVEEEDADNPRSTKRRKSVASIHDPRD